ncbi:unnamed protein product, partial [Coregonus sp. 'balchen']
PLKTLLHKLGLEKQYPNKLTLRSLLEINKDSISDEPVDSLKAVPWYFLKKLLIVNAKCRSCTCLPVDESSIELDSDDNTKDNEVNLLDLITALFLCADSFLQQEMALKMSMCQFAVPLLLPQGTGSQSTLMLWALRGILKEWRPHSQSESKGFEEGNIVLLQMPLISFVRLQACSMSKSQLLNHVLSNDQQNHNIFAHKDMDGGAAPRTISDGLVEACWYLPCGNGDHFPEPLTVANLRGDICASQAQFRFLTQVSTAIFVFLDSVDEDERKLLLSLGDMGSKLFLVVISKGEVSRNVRTSLKEIMDAFKLKSNKMADDIHRKQKVRIEQKVSQLLQNSNDSKTPLSDEQLKDEFGKMWSREIVKISGLEERDIPSSVFKQLRDPFSNRNVNEEFQNVENLTAYGKEPFKARDRHICTMTHFKLKMMFAKEKAKESLQRFSESVIDTCTRFIVDSTKSQTDYHDCLTKETLLHKLGLDKQYPNKLTLRSLLEINKDSISDEPVDSLKAVPWYFLKKLLIVNAKCRSCTCLPVDESSIELDDNTKDNEVNLLDLITALFLCADRFLQQEMALKMSMCQFAGTGSQSTLMLWALRGILKEWRPHSLSDPKGFEEGNIVLLQMPLISFVRLQACSMSKSQFLNHVLSNDQQNHNIFAHKDMDGGAAPRTISDGLVEACWYLPCGNGDHFPEPLTVANLRGDICASQAQFRFLTQVSTAIFVFLDSVDEDERKLLLSLGDMGSKLFLVVISKGEVSRNVNTSVN